MKQKLKQAFLRKTRIQLKYETETEASKRKSRINENERRQKLGQIPVISTLVTDVVIRKWKPFPISVYSFQVQ